MRFKLFAHTDYDPHGGIFDIIKESNDSEVLIEFAKKENLDDLIWDHMYICDLNNNLNIIWDMKKDK
jgi:hypothetical protein